MTKLCLSYVCLFSRNYFMQGCSVFRGLRLSGLLRVFLGYASPLSALLPGLALSAWGIEGTKKPAEHPVRGLKPVHHL